MGYQGRYPLTCFLRENTRIKKNALIAIAEQHMLTIIEDNIHAFLYFQLDQPQLIIFP